jgi:hypothetical protein
MKMIMIHEETLDHLMLSLLDSLVLRLDSSGSRAIPSVPYNAIESEVRDMCERINNAAI